MVDPLRKALSALLPLIPAPVAERVLPWKRAAFRNAAMASPEPARRRLLIGPVNSAGQAYAWAHAAAEDADTSAMNVMFRSGQDPFAFPADQSVPTAYAVSNRRWQRAQRRAVCRRFTHVLIESGRPLFSGGDRVGDDIAALSRAGVRTALLWHGSDIRLPSRHATMDPDSPFRDGAYPEQQRLEEIARRNHALIAETGLPTFVSTPDLLSFVPAARWLPVVVDAPRWAAAAAQGILQRERPVVVHAPSRAGLKGTARIAATLSRLHDEGLVEYRELSGVRAEDMPRVYGEADIVLDQFSLGIYGVAACEAMAGGRLVISHVGQDVRDHVRAATGHELPILETRAGDLEDILRRVLAERDDFRAYAAQGPDFVASVHSGSRSREALEHFLGS